MGKNELREASRAVLADGKVTRALGRFADSYLGSREEVFRDKDFEALRREVAMIKGGAAARLGELADRFQAAAEARGAHVFRAESAGGACAYVLNLARERGVELIVKSKSMATEEIHLNDYLKEHGVEAVETDLGEWIIQLARQKPSHMVMPAIHLTREEVAGVFARETGRPVEPDIDNMVKLARRELRRRFLTAGMGISGANAAVAETGTIVMLTNEGNGRLTTSLPPLHVVVVGLEKLVPRLADVAPILEVLPRSATAQRITTYVSLITGPVPAEGPDGREYPAKELHIILLDNGRTLLAGDEVFRPLLQCVRCAACLNVCPAYQAVGGLFGDVYTGIVGTLLTAFFNDPAKAGQVQNLCLRCERCRDYCPAAIDLPGLLGELRRRTVQKEGLPAGTRLVLERILPNRSLFHSLLRLAQKAQGPLVHRQKIRHLPLFLAGLTQGRVLPALAGRPLRDTVDTLPRPAVSRGKVGLFSGCLIDFVYPATGVAVQRVLAALGLKMVTPAAQTCCGFPADLAGLPDVMVRLARQNIAAFEGLGLEKIITACPTCAVALKLMYPGMLAGDPAWGPRAKELADKVEDFSSFVLPFKDELPLDTEPWTFTYHDSCHLKRRLGVTRQPRELLAGCGGRVVEMSPDGACCGFGGSYALKLPEVSVAVLQRKTDSILGTGAPVVALDCPGCALQIGAGLDFGGAQVQVRHTAEILAGRLKET